MTSTNSHEVGVHAGMIDKDTREEIMISNDSKVCSGASIIDNDTSRECAFEITGNNWYACLQSPGILRMKQEIDEDVNGEESSGFQSSPRILWMKQEIDEDVNGVESSGFQSSPRILRMKQEIDEDVNGEEISGFKSSPRILSIKQERCEGIEEHELNSSPSERYENDNDAGRSRANPDALENEVIPSGNMVGHDTNEWNFMLFNVKSSDLEEVAGGNFDNDWISTGDDHQDDTCVQNGTTADEETSPAESDESQQELDNRPSCELCSLHVQTTSEYYDHLKTHYSETSIKCPLCEKVLMQKICSFNHLRRHAYLKLNISANKHMLHERIHTGVKLYKCTCCNKTFTQQGNLGNREHTHTGVKPYKCTYCNKAFTQKGNQRSHERIHTGAKPYRCTYCNKAFTQRSHVIHHERIHTGSKPYQCTYCNKAFTQQAHLISHERTHTDVKPYKCTYCNKAFTQQGNLEKHERIHIGVKQYECTYCKKAFTQQTHLINHEFVHTGVKPYKCTYCKKAFVNSSDHRKHEQIIHI